MHRPPFLMHRCLHTVVTLTRLNKIVYTIFKEAILAFLIFPATRPVPFLLISNF